MFASRLTTQLERFFSSRPDPEAEALDAFSQDWTTLQWRESAEQGPLTTNHTGSDSPSVEEVPITVGNADRLSTPPSPERGHNLPDTPRVCAGDNATASRLAYLRRPYQIKEISEEGTELLLASWRQKTLQSYDSLFRRWVDWCTGSHFRTCK